MICKKLLFALFAISNLTQAAKKPNVVFILADDLGYGDIGVYGQKKILTPHLDQLAKDGIKFTDHYSGQTVCSPSRASLLLGQHMGHCHVKQNGFVHPEKLDIMAQQLFKKKGYTTAAIGKWGLMSSTWKDENLHAHYFPMATGFDYWYGFESQGYAHFYYPLRMLENKEFIQHPENVGIRKNGYYEQGKGSHAHDLFLEKSLNFIDKNKGNPFFLYIPFAIPHAELVVPSDCKFLALYKSLGWPEIPKIAGTGNTGGAKGNAGYGSPYKDGYCSCDHPHATYAAMISRMDASVGKIRKKLKDLGLKKKTLVIFSSDNGASAEGGQTLDFFKSSGPFRGGKRSTYEGGTRVPFIAAWPETIPVGQESNHVSGFNDFLPTAADLLGIEKPKTTDGISYLPTLLGKPEEQTQAPYRYYWWRCTEAIRKGDWKLIANKNGKPNELYNLYQDPGESHNVIEANPEVVKVLFPLIEDAKKPL